MIATAGSSKVKDPELATWLGDDHGDSREILVEAVLARPVVTLERAGTGRKLFSGLKVTPVSSTERRETLQNLAQFLDDLLDVPPVLLESAGVFAVRVCASQARRLIEHPLVKAIRSNRRLSRQ